MTPAGWSDADVLRWAREQALTRSQQVLAIRELLLHANGDKMSDVDRAICRRALSLLSVHRISNHVRAR